MSSVEKSRLKSDFNRAAGGYDRHARLQKNVAHNLFTMALERWPRDINVLDTGAGTGFFSRFSSLNRTGFKIIALDIARRMCELAAREPATQAVNADMEALPFKNETIDAVFSSLALQWVGSPVQALQESLRVLKPSGEVMMATILDGTLSELSESFAAIGESDRVGKFADEKILQTHFEAAGFANIEITRQPLLLHYPDALTLLRSIKQIGAASKYEDRNRGLLKRASIERLDTAYRAKFQEEGWLAASWNIAYISARKP